MVLLTAHATVQTAVTSMRYGAFDHITKPFTSSDLVQVARRAFGEDESTGAKQVGQPRFDLPSITGVGNAGQLCTGHWESPAMESVFSLIDKVAPTHSNVLVYGKAGREKNCRARDSRRQLTGRSSLHSGGLRPLPGYAP